MDQDVINLIIMSSLKSFIKPSYPMSHIPVFEPIVFGSKVLATLSLRKCSNFKFLSLTPQKCFSKNISTCFLRPALFLSVTRIINRLVQAYSSKLKEFAVNGTPTEDIATQIKNTQVNFIIVC